MKTYRFNWSYKSDVGTWGKGTETPLDDALADHLNRDSPGVLSEVKPEPPKGKAEDDGADESEPDTRAVEKPSSDRMVKAPTAKRDDRGAQTEITKEAFKAVKNKGDG